jgi:predicted RNA-binding protein with PIN domain
VVVVSDWIVSECEYTENTEAADRLINRVAVVTEKEFTSRVVGVDSAMTPDVTDSDVGADSMTVPELTISDVADESVRAVVDTVTEVANAFNVAAPLAATDSCIADKLVSVMMFPLARDTLNDDSRAYVTPAMSSVDAE